jgi:probable nitrogen fixation protein
MSNTDTNLQEQPISELVKSPFARALVQQIRANDPYGTYRTWADELLLKPFIVSRAQKREISIEGEIEAITKGRIMAFYRAIASCIESETGQLSQVVIDLNHEGFGWALVFSGRLLLVVRTLRDAQRFGFDSLEKLIAEGEKLSNSGIELALRHSNVCKL